MNFNRERLPAYICKKKRLFLSEADEEEELEETIESSHGPTIPRRRIVDICSCHCRGQLSTGPGELAALTGQYRALHSKKILDFFFANVWIKNLVKGKEMEKESEKLANLTIEGSSSLEPFNSLIFSFLFIFIFPFPPLNP